jgi:N-acetylneuraminic acid mutarotase
LLPDGKVLVAGGRSGNSAFVNSAELYDPATETWSYTGSLNTPRAAHTATLLPNGKVLAAGGYNLRDNSPNALNSAELYDPATGTWSSTGSLNGGRVLHTATLLPSGKVLVVDGYCGVNCANSRAELYDPDSGKWVYTGSPQIERFGEQMATLLENGKVLVAGGLDFWTFEYTDGAELYDPATGEWSLTGKLEIARLGRVAPLLSNGKVLVVGTSADAGNSAELYDPNTERWAKTGSLEQASFFSLATTLSDGKVLITGGTVGGPASNRPAANSAELYDPAAGSWTVAHPLNVAREDHTATLLGNGKVLVTGGVNTGSSGFHGLTSAELYNPATGPIASPKIVSASVAGKKLFVYGENFDIGAVILLNGEEQRTKNGKPEPNTILIGKKAGKFINPNDRLQVRNANGSLSEDFYFSPP